MTDPPTCPTCALPMVWSIWRERMQCSVYGQHVDNRWADGPIAEVIRYDFQHERNARRRGA